MITKNGKLTSWTDTLGSLLDAAREAAPGEQVTELVSEKIGAKITAGLGTATTDDRRLFDLALQAGWWIIETQTGWEILFDWPRDPANPPNNTATHITRTVIPLSEAERRWGMANLRQPAYRDRLPMWKAGPRAWVTTVQAMEGVFGPEK